MERAARGDERLREGGEVLHVRSKNDRAIGHDGFDRVLSAARGQALADEDDRGDGIPIAQFAGRIEEETVGRGGSRDSLRRTEDMPRSRNWATISRVRSTWRGAITRKRKGIPAQFQENLRQDLFFARVCAAPEQDRAIRINSQGVQNRAWNLGPQRDIVRVEFDTADPPDAVAAYA